MSLRSAGHLGDAHQGRQQKRRGRWLAGYADIGWSNSLGWYEGFRLLVALNPTRVITGFGSASTKDQPLAETFFALRCEANPRAPRAWDLQPQDHT